MPAVTSGGAAPPAQQELVDEIIQLGRMFEQTRTPSRVEEKKLARVKAQELLQQVRDLGRYPKEKRGGSIAERQLAEQVRRVRKAKQFSPEQEAELEALQQAERDARAEARIADAKGPPNPMDGVRGRGGRFCAAQA